MHRFRESKIGIALVIGIAPTIRLALGIGVAFAIGISFSASMPSAGFALESFPLAREGRPAATIVIARKAGLIPSFAARELQDHVRKITGATLPVLTDGDAVQGPRILIGASRSTEELGLRNADFQPQEYLIGFRPNTLLLLGRDREDDAFPVRVLGRIERTDGKFGTAVAFSDACRGITVSDPGFSDEAGTLEAWVWLAEERRDAGTIFRLDGTPWTYHIVDTQGQGIRYVVYDGKTGRSVTSAALPSGWHHLAAIHDAKAGKFELFVDGASCGTQDYAATTCASAPFLHLGAYVAEGVAANRFVGRLDEVRLSRTARRPSPDWGTKPTAAEAEDTVLLRFDEEAGPSIESSGHLRLPSAPPPSDAFSPQGTLYAVHDFLERFCEVRWYAPTDLGMVYPRKPTLAIEGQDIRRRPAFEFRHHAPSGIGNEARGLVSKPGGEDLSLFISRRRLGGRNFMTNHSFYDFYDRFWEKNPGRPDLFEAHRPEYFARGYEGKPPQLCMTSPELVAQVVKDSRSRLDQGAEYVQLVPMDNDQQCRCAGCQALLDKGNRSRQFSTGKSSGLFWTFANAVAREIRISHPEKPVCTIAYYDYAFPPSFALEPNILVGPCLHTRNWWSPSMERNDMAFYAGWRAKAPGRMHCVWLYQCFPDEIGDGNGFVAFPGFHAHTLARQFRMFAADEVRGVFLCGVADYIDGYLTFRYLDDPAFDVDQALEEFFTRYYGPAAGPMRDLYFDVERTYTDPANYPEAVRKEDAHFHQSEEMAWKYLGTAERMAAWARRLEEAKAAVAVPSATAEERERVAVFERDTWGRMLEGKKRWEAKQPKS